MQTGRYSGFVAALAVCGLLTGCARPHAPAAVTAAAAGVVVPSEAVLRDDWLKGYFTGLAAGEKRQSQIDQAKAATQPSPPPPAAATPAPPAPAAPVADVPPTNFVPEGPAEEVR